MQPQSAQNIYVPQNAANNSTVRANQPAVGNIYRQNPSSPAPRNRYVHSTPMYPTVHPSVVLGQFTAPYATRTPQLQQCQYSPQFYPHMYYSCYVQQQPQQQRATVNPGVGVNLSSAMAVQPAGTVSGPTPTGNQGQMPLGVAPVPASAVLSVTNTTAAPPVGVAPLVGLSHPPAQQPQNQPQTKGKLRSHALQIIHPITNRNILDDLDIDKNEFTNGGPSATSIALTPVANTGSSANIDIGSSTAFSALAKSTEQLPEISKPHTENMQTIETSTHQVAGGTIHTVERNFKDISQQQTPIVSAMTDAPSVEIFPMQPQKQRTKKPQNNSTVKHDQTVCQGKKDENTGVINATANYNCVQELLPTNDINQQVPQQEQLKGKEMSLEISSDSNAIINQREIRESCTEDYTGVSEQDKHNLFESTKTMQLEEKKTVALPQQKQVINLNYDEKQQELKQQETQHLNVNNGNKVTKEATLLETNDNAINNNDLVNNNNSIKKGNNVNKINVIPKNATAVKNDELDKNNENIDKSKSLATGAKIEFTAAAAHKSSSNSNNNTTHSKEVTTLDETDKANISISDDLKNTEVVESSSRKPTLKTSTNNVPSIPIKTEGMEETVIKNDNNTVSREDKEENASGDTNTTSNESMVSNTKQPFKSLIRYNEGQWSPSNPSGKKQYDRVQLLHLREAHASSIHPEVKISSIIAQNSLMPSFANHGTKKVQSMVGGFGGARGSSSSDSNYQNYLKQSSMSGRGGPESGHHNRNINKPIIHLNLSLNQEVKLNEADNAWRPRVLVKGADAQVKPEREKEELIRRVRGILNKLTPEKFEPLVEEIIKLKIDTMDKMEAVMILVFEKAIDEPNFSVSYARLCYRLISEVKARDERMESGTKTNLASFRSALLDKMEREFTDNVTTSSAKEAKLQPIRESIQNCKDENEKVELEALLDEEERKIRRRSGGTVRFIGELFKIAILTGKIIYTCIEALLKDPDNEDMLECLCKLLTTVGQKFEQTNISKDDKRKYSLDSVIQRMQNIASKSENSKISSRVRFMLQDVIDLRRKKWQSTRNEAPKTMEQIEKEANNEQLSNPYNYMSSMSGSSIAGKRDDRGGRTDGRNYGGSHSQRGDAGSLKRQQGGIGGGSHSQSGNNNNDDTWHVQTGKGNRSLVVDSSKLVGMAVDMNNKKMGAAAFFQWGNASSQPTSTPSNSFAALSVDSNRSSDRDRERDRGGPRNKGSYNKGSMERDRYDHDRMLSRTSSTHASRENSSSRSMQSSTRIMGSGNSSNMQKSSSHSKYQLPMSSSSLSRMTSSKITGAAGGGTLGSNFFRDSQQQSSFANPNSTHHQQHFNAGTRESIQSSAALPEVFEEPSTSDLKLIKIVVMDMVENAANSKCIDSTTVSCIEKIKDKQLCGLLYYILTDYVHLGNVGPMCRRHLANVVAYLIENKYISAEHFRFAYKNFALLASVLIVDIPELWLYIFEFTVPLLVKKLITVNELWNSTLRESESTSFGQKFLKTFLQYCTREVGPSFTRDMWKKNHLKWSDFMDESEVAKFIQTNKFQYVENENIQPDVDSKESKEKCNKRVVEHVEQLLREDSNADNIIDYINGNIVDVDKSFIKSLTTILTSFAIKDSSSDYSLDISCFQKICIPVLLRYLDSKEDLELECLYAIQLLVHSLEHPRGLLGSIFAELNDADVIPHDTFIAWRDSKDQSAGKGVAVKALNPFFNQVINGETSDDN